MANFSKGQRVKRVAHPGMDASITGMPIGATGTVTCAMEGMVEVDVDGRGHWGCYPFTLAPLTPPASDAWAADKVRQVTRPVYTEPERVKERA